MLPPTLGRRMRLSSGYINLIAHPTGRAKRRTADGRDDLVSWISVYASDRGGIQGFVSERKCRAVLGTL
jgi:hypothetical protein